MVERQRRHKTGAPLQESMENDVIEIEGFNAALFSAEAVDEETKAFNARIAAAEFEAPARSDFDLAYERTLSPGGGMLPKFEPCPRAETRTIPGPAGEISLRIIPPSKGDPEGIYLHLHGGGFCLGSSRGQDPMLEAMADNAQVVSISVEYRLAPEHPFPAGLADVEAALWWVIRNGKSEFGTDRIVMGGESAGANLSVAAALRLRDRRGFTDLAGLNLSQGGFDLRMTPSMRLNQDALVIQRATLEHHLNRYLGGRSPEHPEISPLLADLKNLPPAIVTVGTADPTLDDNVFLYCRWIAAGNEAELAIYPGGVHGFTFLPIRIGRDASRRIEGFVKRMCTR
jgi:acetyl esterase